MEELLNQLTDKFNYWAYFVIMMTGIYAMIVKSNLMKKLIGLSIFQTSIMLFYVAMGSKKGATIPILASTAHGQVSPIDYINPLPHVLMLTAIVVSVATLGVALSLTQRLYRKHETLEENEILDQIRRS